MSISHARTFAIESSGRVGSIAVARGDELLAEETFPHGLQHAAQMIPIIDRLTRAAGWIPRDVEHLYLSIGPGSFTGLRIAVTVAKTLALATGVKIVAVPSVRVLLENAPKDARNVIIVLDAKRGQIFTARFSRLDGKKVEGEAPAEPSTERRDLMNGLAGLSPCTWTESEPAHLDTLAAMIDRAPKPVHLIGEGIDYHRTAIPSSNDVIVTAPDSWRARASVVWRIGREMAERSEFADPWTLTPIYIRLPEAEEKWRAAQEKHQRPKQH